MKLKHILVIVVLLMATGCAGNTICAENISLQEAITREPVGFFYGIWHGLIAPIAMICHLFDNTIAVWAVYNNGGWYWFGFLLGVGAFSSGCSNANRKK